MSIERRLSERLLGELEKAGQAGTTRQELAQLVGDSERDAVTSTLLVLSAEGVAVEWGRRWYALRSTPWRVGVLERVSRRESVVRLVDGKRGATELWVAERDRAGARTGDRVLVRPVRKVSRQQGRQVRSAIVLKVLQARKRRLVGRLDHHPRGLRLWSFSTEEALDAQDVEIEEPGTARDGDYVVAELGAARRDGSVPARVVEVLGPVERPGVDVLVVLRHFGIEEGFDREALAEAAALPEEIPSAETRRREDYREDATVTIDGETARDFDDAIWVEPRGRGWLVKVHIADVSHYVTPGSAIDRAAEARGTSVYFPDRAVPMLPRELSENLCSLVPERDRLTTSVEMRFDGEGRRLSARVVAGVIRSHHRLTYRGAQDALDRHDAGRDPGGDLSEAALASLLAARDCARALREMRSRRGALDFYLPEIHLEVDHEGELIEARPAASFETHRIIEELMIATNEAVAEQVASKSSPEGEARPLYRVHPPPKDDDVDDLRRVCRALGVEIPEAPTTRHAEDAEEPLGALAPILEAARAAGIGPVIEGMALRALGRAVYSPECDGHSALAAPYYCHFTSPIRRYPDLVVHRAVLGLEAPEAPDGAEARGRELSRLERRAESAEREIRKWKKIRYLVGKEGSTWRGAVTGVTDFGLFVVLDELGLDGLLPIDHLTDDEYQHDERLLRLVGRGSGRTFQLGDPIEVIISRVNEAQRRIDVELADLPEPKPRGRQRRPGASRPGEARSRRPTDRRGSGGRRRRR
ncbi:MAG TPA: VacB/RNase II family 3'-5' exoribonuclease [Thermoanaerobaculia bacterium]|nr:VacB/RNase II family 3'-5' exoribonuclease [Thermoanaerobaculia bacterium]